MMKAVVLALAMLLGSVTLAFAGERVDLFSPDGQRQGYAVIDERTGRVDFYDAQNRRTGWGKLQPSGKVERFDLQGQRQAETALPLKVDRERGR